ncbi:extracellular solute-binding protein [Cohnella candidum]|uniref:Extracellular solute-binding protein n=1 Tax=Cohnella candidum TaxID=2674991 RepID=A0A3G3K4Y9_9BACL|nr:extracellular solute-binding protein [Cohnella candidum]AYQ75241.1 extracellular solute-binding protein [Cohnella candidum]
MKKASSILLIAVLFSVFLSACSSRKNAVPPSPSPIEISVFAQQDATQDLKTNEFTRLLENKFGVKFDWELVPTEGAKEKRQISMASGKYPDAYILTSFVDQFSQADVLRYGKQGVFYPLNDLIDKYAPHIKAAMESNADLRALSTAPDGNIYGLVGYSECYHCSYPNKMWLNTAWLKKLHLAMPVTTEDFRSVLRAFKNRDPNGNGIADEIPLSGSTEDFGVRVIPYLMNGFIYDDDRTYLTMNGGKAGLAPDKEEWREGLRYIKSLYDEDLIDPGAFTQSADVFRKIGENENAQILGAGAAMHPDIFVDTGPGNRRGSDYNPLPPLKGPHAAYSVFYESGINSGAKFVITDKASEEARIALIKIADYMYTPEGQANAEVGKEGVDWRRPAAGENALGPDSTPEFTRIPVKAGEKPHNTAWGGMGHFYMPREYRDSWTQGMDIYAPDGYERRLYEATKLYDGTQPKEVYPIWSVWIDAAAADEENILQTNIKNYVDESAVQFITGDKDLNKDWDTYLQGLKTLGSARYLEIMQRAYDDWASLNGSEHP